MVVQQQEWTRVASLAALKKTNCLTVHVDHHTLVLFAYGDSVYAVDNRCPHMGFPLNKGTVKDGILTCHWHHARFDLVSGGAFDLWADDIPAFPVQIDGDDVLVNVQERRNMREHHRQRVEDGLQYNLTLVVAKSVIGLHHLKEDPVGPFKVGLLFGTRYRGSGWGRGLTILGCMMNMIPYLDPKDQPRAMYHGLSAVADNTEGESPHFTLHAIPTEDVPIPTLKRWFRQFVEVRDTRAAERALLSALHAGADDRQMADMLFAAATDHRYIDVGHTLDFINKAFEGLDVAGWDHAATVLPSVVPLLTGATRMEEDNAWRSPIDLVDLLADAFDKLPDVLEAGASKQTEADRDALVAVLLGDDPQATIDALLDALRSGVSMASLAGVVSYAAARRIAHFHISNEFGDWDTALHTFTFANAVHMGLRRVASPDLLRGVFDAAMSVYLDRFLNIPSTPIPQPAPVSVSGDTSRLLGELETLLNNQQQVNRAGEMVARYLVSGGDPDALMAKLGYLLLREDRDFHTIQCVEASFRQYTLLRGDPAANHVLIAAARYLAAHAPTMRAQGQTYQIAERLDRGEALFE